jgi:signal transduction histidine kinase
VSNYPSKQPSVPLLVRRPHLVEWATVTVALLSATVGMVNYLAIGQAPGLIGVLLALAGLALVLRWPWLGVALAFAAPLAGSLVGVDPLVLWSISVFIVLIATLRGLPPLPAGALIGVSNCLSVVLHGQQIWIEPLAILAFVVAIAFAFIGSSLRTSQQYWAEVARNADEALATREAEAERRVAEERLRIAQDLHDTIGHEIAITNMRIGAAEAHLPRDAVVSRAHLVEARASVQSVLQETQRVLALLHQVDDIGPVANYEGLAALIDSFRAIGLDVVATVSPTPISLDPQISAAVYRIVQEGLTNAGKHGNGQTDVSVATEPDAIDITVTNAKAANPSPNQGGFGLIGMRERVASANGRLEIIEDEQIFTVHAVLPLNEGVNA